MPGIVGFAGRQRDAADNQNVLKEMALALESESRFRQELQVSGSAGLGRVSLGIVNAQTQPLWNRERSVCIVMEGELYDTDALHRRFAGGEAGGEGSDAQLLLALYERRGRDFVDELNGNFIAAIWDEPTQRLTLANDRLGLHPLYYTHGPNGLIFGSGLRALLAEPSVSQCVDHIAIAQFLTFDHLLHQRTLLKDVRLLAQASVLTYENDQVRIHNYWRPQHPATYTLRSEEEWMSDMMARLRRAVQRQAPGALPVGSAGMLLSGGLDSRALLALLKETTDLSGFATFTWGIPGCDDARFSREVARKMGTDHRFFELKPDWLLEHAEACVRATDGMGNIANLHARATLDQETKHAQVLYKGFLGDAMMGFAQRHQHWADYDPDTAIQAHLDVHRSQGVVTFGPEDHQALFSAEMQQEVGNAVLEEYRAGMAASGSSQLADQRIYYDYCQRVPRHTLNGVQVVRSRAVVRLPFADSDLIDLMLQVPPGMRYKRRIMRNAFVRDFPDLARIPLPDTGLPMLDCARDIWIRTQRWMRWHFGKIGLGSDNYLGRRPYKDYATWFRTVLRDWVESTLLDSRSLQRGYFQQEFVRNIVEEHMSGKDHSIRLGAFMSLELWHRQFIDRN